MKPELGKYYKFYPNCKIDKNNEYVAFIQSIISFEDSKNEIIYDCMFDHNLNEHEPIAISLYDVWNDFKKCKDFINVNHVDYFLKLSIHEYDKFYSYAAKNNEGKWITFNLHTPYQRGEIKIE